MTTAQTPGWPTDRGPIATLALLGLIKAPPINWLRSPTTSETRNGTSWRFAPVFLRAEAIRALAALTLEGYEVQIDPHHETGQLLHVTIRNERH